MLCVHFGIYSSHSRADWDWRCLWNLHFPRWSCEPKYSEPELALRQTWTRVARGAIFYLFLTRFKASPYMITNYYFLSAYQFGFLLISLVKLWDKIVFCCCVHMCVRACVCAHTHTHTHTSIVIFLLGYQRRGSVWNIDRLCWFKRGRHPIELFVLTNQKSTNLSKIHSKNVLHLGQQQRRRTWDSFE